VLLQSTLFLLYSRIPVVSISFYKASLCCERTDLVCRFPLDVLLVVERIVWGPVAVYCMGVFVVC